MSETSVFHWQRPVLEDWARDLAALSPRFDRLSHLALLWEPGFPDDPIQRWFLYDCVPWAALPDWKQQAIQEPLCTCPLPVTQVERCRWCRKLRSPGRARNLEYLGTTGCFPFPFWVIQGEQGGHRYSYTQVEVQWAKLMRQQPAPPVPGRLSYAPFDQRVIRKLRAYDRTRHRFASILTAADHEQVEAATAFRRALADYVDQAVEAAFDDVPLVRRHGLRDELPRDASADRVTIDTEAAREAFIHDEEFAHAPG